MIVQFFDGVGNSYRIDLWSDADGILLARALEGAGFETSIVVPGERFLTVAEAAREAGA